MPQTEVRTVLLQVLFYSLLYVLVRLSITDFLEEFRRC